MQNIDALYFLQPIVTIAFSAGLVIYWNRKRSFTRAALVLSLLAYAGAIAVKIILQTLTYSEFVSRVGNNPVALGAYFGVQTVFFEVGGAYLVAVWAVSRGTLRAMGLDSGSGKMQATSELSALSPCCQSTWRLPLAAQPQKKSIRV